MTSGLKLSKVAPWAASILLLVFIAISYARLRALYELHFAYKSVFNVLSNDLNFSNSWSELAALIIAPILAVAWIPLLGATAWYLMTRKIDSRWVKRFGIAYLAFLLVYGTIPALHAFFDPYVCSKKDGTIDKFYVELPDHSIVLYPDGGYDNLHNKKIPATPNICRRWDEQRRGVKPRQAQLITDVHSIRRLFNEYKDPLIWYYRSTKGEIELYDAPGNHPFSDEAFKPITPEVYALALQQADARAAKDAAAKKKADDEQAARDLADQRGQERQDQLARKQQAAQERAAQEELRRKREAAVQQLLKIRLTSSPTEWDCAFDADGAYLAGRPNAQRELVPYSLARVAAERVNITATVLLLKVAIPAISVRILGPDFETDAQEQCLAFTISPAPAYASPEQIATINNVIDSLSALGTTITQRYVPDNPPVVFGAPASNGAAIGADIIQGGASSYTGPGSYTGSGYITGGGYIGGGRR